jgi:DMSO/TMAO reductase YedYZ heme-binding membrane subunit
MTTTQLWWSVARAGGLLAYALLALGVVWGLLLSSRIFGKRPRPAWLLDLHRFLGGLAVVFVAVHVGAILLDSYVPFSPVQVLVPFASSWHPTAVAWGIVGLYLLAAVEITSLLRRRLSQRVWRKVHYLSFPLFVFTTVHTLTAGTDRNNPVLQIAVFSICGLVVLLSVLRIRPQQRTPIERRPARPRPARRDAADRPAPPRPVPGPPPGPARRPVSVTIDAEPARRLPGSPRSRARVG